GQLGLWGGGAHVVVGADAPLWARWPAPGPRSPRGGTGEPGGGAGTGPPAGALGSREALSPGTGTGTGTGSGSRRSTVGHTGTCLDGDSPAPAGRCEAVGCPGWRNQASPGFRRAECQVKLSMMSPLSTRMESVAPEVGEMASRLRVSATREAPSPLCCELAERPFTETTPRSVAASTWTALVFGSETVALPAATWRVTAAA